MVYYVYLFKFPNGKYYVGRTNNYEARLITHKYNAKRKKRAPLYYAINKYGWENIEKSIIDTVTNEKDCIIQEYNRIVEYDSIKNGYNLTLNTEIGGSNWIHREDTEDFRLFKEYMKKITAGENNGMYGKTHSKNSTELMKQKAKGRFTLPWFIERYGEELGTKKYEDRRLFLKSRKYEFASNGRFSKQ